MEYWNNSVGTFLQLDQVSGFTSFCTFLTEPSSESVCYSFAEGMVEETEEEEERGVFLLDLLRNV